MRLVARAFASALALGAATAAQSATLELRPGETLLEIETEGRSVTRAGQARLLVAVTGTGSTPIEARRDAEEDLARVRAAARGTGVADADMSPMTDATLIGFVGNVAEDFDVPALAIPGVPAESRAQRALEIVVRDPAAAERVRRAVEDTGAASVGAPRYEADDPDAARQRARADAFSRARADAEALAAVAGMRVSRVIRISERVDREGAALAMMRALSRQPSAAVRGTQVDTLVNLSVDFALIAR
jgi:hypothetical protein